MLKMYVKIIENMKAVFQLSVQFFFDKSSVQ